MYLANLSNEQKELFLDLSMYSINSHGAVDEREKLLLRKYCEEMKIDYREDRKIQSIEEILSGLKNISNETELKKMTVELLAIMYADEELQDEESELLSMLQKTFGFDSNLMGELTFVTRHLLLSYQLLQNII